MEVTADYACSPRYKYRRLVLSIFRVRTNQKKGKLRKLPLPSKRLISYDFLGFIKINPKVHRYIIKKNMQKRKQISNKEL